MIVLKGLFVIILAGIVGYCIGKTFGWIGIPISCINGCLLGNLFGRWIVEDIK